MTAPSDALDPVRAELLRAARADADAVLDRARADADETLRLARGTAERILAKARDLGAADGHAAAARERVRAAEDAWARELAARAEVYADLRAEVRAGVRQALADGAVTSARCAETARALLGADARITAVPGGGVTADVPGRHLDLSADTLAGRALTRLGVLIESLWDRP
ncbi:hypothetical protein AV521_39920 [Streptomyces sp. IMTB 2501]|uniref:hypothetical protein n=1 Tax=Streptomyces sp. IMTB 2501 TaxID=1776340 RepID=UPI00096E9821|nr:hypothetical protein [Streptomyces sp. IMTB 2501]OLZ63160.1 hypothetical protein AV521_39920 [Streptomyces sp. IMTB 2501]